MSWDEDMWDADTEIRRPVTTWEADQDAQEMVGILRRVILDQAEGCFVLIAYTKDGDGRDDRPVFIAGARTRGSGAHGLHFWKEATTAFLKTREEWARGIVHDFLTDYEEERRDDGSGN